MRLFPLVLVPLALSVGCAEFGLTRVEPVPDVEVEPDGDEALPPTEEEPPEEPGEEEEPAEEEPPEEEEPPVDDDPAPEDDCEDTSDLIYVIDRDDETLGLFDPDTNTLTSLGGLDCGLWAGTPGSMTVGRDGIAWVRYSDDTLYAVDLDTLDCAEATEDLGFGHYGMGYSTEDADTWREELFVANGGQLASLDTTGWALDVRGPMPSHSELTGNGEGELWAVLPLENPARIVQLDKADASVVQTHLLSGFPDPFGIDTFAFAGWGGDFYLFVRSYGLGNSTDVFRVDAGGAMTAVARDTGWNVVGAGVSTCAPGE